MILTIVIVFISLIGLIILHELGHFFIAKKFGVKVEEFGIGLPPRLFSEKFGETIYSLNLLPFGAFVKIYGEEKSIEDSRSFSQKPIWQRALIVLGGVVSFWIIAAILLTVIMGLGAPTAVSDEENQSLINPKVQIVMVSSGSPAEIAGLKAGDTIASLKLKIKNEKFLPDNSQGKINKVKEVQDFTNLHKGEEIVLTIERGKEVFDIELTPRVVPPEEEGPMGIALVRTALKSYPFYLAPIKGIEATFNLTGAVIFGLIDVFENLLAGKGLPAGTRLMGPIGIGSLMTQVAEMGLVYYLQFIALISIYLAVFNLLPIPAVDGGRLLFLGVEKIRGRALNHKLEQTINSFFFILLILLMLIVTYHDLTRIW